LKGLGRGDHRREPLICSRREFLVEDAGDFARDRLGESQLDLSVTSQVEEVLRLPAVVQG